MPRRITPDTGTKEEPPAQEKPRARNSSTGPVTGGGWEENPRPIGRVYSNLSRSDVVKVTLRGSSPRRPREARRIRAMGLDRSELLGVQAVPLGRTLGKRGSLYDGRAQRARLHFRGSAALVRSNMLARLLPALAAAKAIAAASSGESANATATVFRSSRYWPSQRACSIRSDHPPHPRNTTTGFPSA